MKYLNHKYKRKKLVDKPGIHRFVGNFYLYKEIATLAKKAKLKAEQDKIVKLLVFDSKYLRSKNYFEDDRTQNCFVFEPVFRYS